MTINTEVLLKLIRLGFQFAGNLETMIQDYQALHGLSLTGKFDDATLIHLNHAYRFCKHPDVMQDVTTSCKWQTPNVTWTIVAALPNFPAEQLQAAYQLAFDYWKAVCGLKPTYVADPSQAMIQIGTRSIDGPQGVLAESELPCGNVTLCHQWYDTTEKWAISETPINNQIDLVRVACHELGHALGLQHGPTGNLMAPVYSPTIRKPQAWDIQEMQSRYGPPVAVSAPPTPSDTLTIKIAGSIIEIPGYRVTKLT